MTDHLADARACIQSAAQAPDPDIKRRETLARLGVTEQTKEDR